MPFWRAETFGAFGIKNCDLRQPPPPPITDPQQLAQARNCFACHRETGGTLMGPSFEQFADRYRDAPLPPGELEIRIRCGSVRQWNALPMLANPKVSDADLAILVPWISRASASYPKASTSCSDVKKAALGGLFHI